MTPNAKAQVGRTGYLALVLWASAALPARAAPPATTTAGPDANPAGASSPPTLGQAAPATPTAYVGAPSGYRRAITWDLNVDGALGATLGNGSTLAGFGRVRAGVLSIHDADVLALGASYEYGSLQKFTFGVQAEYINDNSGLWVQLGALLDTQPRPGAMAAVGYALFGAEVQLRSDAATGATVAVYGKLRIPIGFLAYELRK